MSWFDILKVRRYNFDNPIQENPKALAQDYRQKWAQMLTAINVTVPLHEEYALRDKANKEKHLKFAQDLRNYGYDVRHLFTDYEGTTEGPDPKIQRYYSEKQ
tara:strand:+ start:252 stop:557 length:306 start_codon:yes stop_codon:yes gene_type:complete